MTAKRILVLVVVLGIVMCGGGFFLGTIYTQSLAQRRENEKLSADQRWRQELRKSLLGRWVEEGPVSPGEIPLRSHTLFTFRPDGTYTEESRLLSAEGRELNGMRWANLGSWYINETHDLVLVRESVNGPTPRVPGITKYIASPSAGELTLYALESPDRGDYDRKLRREFAQQQLTEPEKVADWSDE